MPRIDRCKKCASMLVDGPSVERSGTSERFSVRVAGIPTKICSRGCEGAYWYWPDFGVEVIDLIAGDTENTALRRGALRARSACRACSSELVDRADRQRLRSVVRFATG